MNFFIERGKIPADAVSAQPLLEALLPLLEPLSLEDRMEVLLLLAHLLWLKARALLPTLPKAERLPTQDSASFTLKSPISPHLLHVWEEAMRQTQFYLARPASEEIAPILYLKPITQMDLLRTYLAVRAAYEKRQRRYEVQLPPLSLEVVAQHLESYFATTPRTTFSALLASFPQSPLYWAIGLFLILSWIQEERLRYEPISLWEGHLHWIPPDSSICTNFAPCAFS